MISSIFVSGLLQPCVASGFILLFAVVWIASLIKRRARNSYYSKRTPPIISIPEHDLFTRPREVYERALAQHGPVIAVRRKGRLEYIVNERFAHDVLTTNTHYSFEEGTAYILNLSYFNKLFTAFFVEIDDLVRNAIVTRMPLVVEQVFPAFMKHANTLLQELQSYSEGKQGPKFVHALDHTHRSISEAMALVILGPQFVTTENLEVIEKVAHDMAVVTGIHQNTSWWGTTFPNVWRLATWVKVSCTTIRLYYGTIGLQIWRKLRSEQYNINDAKENPELYKGSVVEYLACKNVNPVDGKVGFFAYLRITALVLGIVFASVHQTASVAVWIIYELAARPEYLPALREELFENAGIDSTTDENINITYEVLKKSVRLDSFIREVMRTKGDTLSSCRMTTTDVSICGYTIPKGYLVFPLTSLAHMSKSYHGADAETFNGDRWVDTEKRAVMVDPTYYPFGLGRWACPGRALAVAEIKMIVWALICRATPVLKGGAYSVPDPLNVTSVAPGGEMTLVSYTS